MPEPVTGTLVGWKMWTVIGIIGLMALIIGGGYALPDTRPYVEKSVTWGMNLITALLK